MTISLISLHEQSRHEYEGSVKVDVEDQYLRIPFQFSDMSGRLRLSSIPGVPYEGIREIWERCTDLVMDRIVGTEF